MHLPAGRGVVRLERGDQAGLNEGGLATSTRTGDKEQRLLRTDCRQPVQRFPDLFLAAGIQGACGGGVTVQSLVGILDPGDVVRFVRAEYGDLSGAAAVGLGNEASDRRLRRSGLAAHAIPLADSPGR